MQLITTVRDKLLLLYKGHYYSKILYNEKKWRCINTSNCYAAIVVDEDYAVQREKGKHMHRPKNFVRRPDGKYKLVPTPKTKSTDYVLFEIVQENPDENS